jgi:hypothetical protein
MAAVSRRVRRAVHYRLRVEDHADHPLGTFRIQHEAIDWAKRTVTHLTSLEFVTSTIRKKPDHWRAVYKVLGANSNGAASWVRCGELLYTTTPHQFGFS